MITAYFDDSGTHESSGIVLVAGIYGTDTQLLQLDAGWGALLSDPMCGYRPPLCRFHMYDCYNSLGEFSGWSRTESDFLVHRLQTEIINSGVLAYGIAVPRNEWDEMIKGYLRPTLGGPEGFCIRNCLLIPIQWALSEQGDRDVAFVFDNRPRGVMIDAQAVFDAFHVAIGRPEDATITFASSKKVRPLQAADLIAWEVYTHAINFYETGNPVMKRDQLRRLVSGISKFRVQMPSRENMQRIVELWARHDEKDLAAYARHFENFNPDDPDYSNFSSG